MIFLIVFLLGFEDSAICWSSIDLLPLQHTFIMVVIWRTWAYMSRDLNIMRVIMDDNEMRWYIKTTLTLTY